MSVSLTSTQPAASATAALCSNAGPPCSWRLSATGAGGAAPGGDSMSSTEWLKSASYSPRRAPEGASHTARPPGPAGAESKSESATGRTSDLHAPGQAPITRSRSRAGVSGGPPSTHVITGASGSSAGGAPSAITTSAPAPAGSPSDGVSNSTASRSRAGAHLRSRSGSPLTVTRIGVTTGDAMRLCWPRA